ncbi:GIY-YIG nuclease family protein [Vallitaleaceae bacterium 9-2]
MRGIQGVYVITNTANKKKYVGISRDLEHEWDTIRTDLEQRRGNRQMVDDYHQFGGMNFRFDIVLVSDDEKELRRRESQEAYKHDVWLNGYNTTATLNYHNISEEDLLVYKTAFLGFIQQINDGKYFYKDMVEALGLGTSDLEVILDHITEEEMLEHQKKIRLVKLASSTREYYVEIKSIS